MMNEKGSADNTLFIIHHSSFIIHHSQKPMTTLQQLITRGGDTTIRNLNLPENRAAALEIQTRLCDFGLLDPIISGNVAQAFGPAAKADGVLGANSMTAVFEFSRLAGIPYFFDGQIRHEWLQALTLFSPETNVPLSLLPLPGDSASVLLAKRVLRYMDSKKYWIARSPNMYNIVYVEGMNADGTDFHDSANQWNDRRLVIRIRPGGQPELIHNFDATTEPGIPVRSRPHPLGIARIAFGQYKSWKIGLHKGKQAALCQADHIRIHRDKDANGFRTGDKIFIGSDFGINQHSTTVKTSTVGDWSAGCLVGREWGEHLIFLGTVKSDVRHTLNANYRFVSTVIPGDELTV